MPTIREGTHRGTVAEALSTSRWMDCHDVAERTVYDPDSASSVLSDLYRDDYVHRREREASDGPTYEYQLKTNVSVG